MTGTNPASRSPVAASVTQDRSSARPAIAKNDSTFRAAELAVIFARLTPLPPAIIAAEIRHLQRLARQLALAPEKRHLLALAQIVASRLGDFKVGFEDGELNVFGLRIY